MFSRSVFLFQYHASHFPMSTKNSIKLRLQNDGDWMCILIQPFNCQQSIVSLLQFLLVSFRWSSNSFNGPKMLISSAVVDFCLAKLRSLPADTTSRSSRFCFFINCNFMQQFQAAGWNGLNTLLTALSTFFMHYSLLLFDSSGARSLWIIVRSWNCHSFVDYFWVGFENSWIIKGLHSIPRNLL